MKISFAISFLPVLPKLVSQNYSVFSRTSVVPVWSDVWSQAADDASYCASIAPHSWLSRRANAQLTPANPSTDTNHLIHKKPFTSCRNISMFLRNCFKLNRLGVSCSCGGVSTSKALINLCLKFSSVTCCCCMRLFASVMYSDWCTQMRRNIWANYNSYGIGLLPGKPYVTL